MDLEVVEIINNTTKNEIILDGYIDCQVDTIDAPQSYFAFVIVYTVFSCALVIPLVLLSRTFERKRLSQSLAVAAAVSPRTRPNYEDGNDDESEALEMIEIQHKSKNIQQKNHKKSSDDAQVDHATNKKGPQPINAVVTSLLSESEEMRMNGNGPRGLSASAPAQIMADPPSLDFHPENFQSIGGSARDFRFIGADRASASESRTSAASTTMLKATVQNRKGRKRPLRNLSARMRWNHRISLMGSEAANMHVKRSIRRAGDSQSQVSEEERSISRSRVSWVSRPGINTSLVSSRRSGTSEAANSILIDESIDGEAEYYRQRYLQRSRRRPSYTDASVGSMASLMPPLSPDALSPEDAADANDPGRSTHLPSFKLEQASHRAPRKLAPPCEWLLDLAEPDFETKRLLEMALPTSLGAILDPLFRIIMVVLISHLMDTDSMVAYVITILLFSLSTEELAGAISDAASNMLQNALAYGNEDAYFHAGQTVQLALFMQVFVGVPVLLIWFFYIYPVVVGLTRSTFIADIAVQYTHVIIFDYLIQALSQTFMVPYQLTGLSQFELTVDISMSIVTIIAVAIAARFANTNLATVGAIQLIIGCTKALTKVIYVITRGWISPYKKGLVDKLSILSFDNVKNFIMVSTPLFIGSLVELREWPILTFAIHHGVGGAETAAWAITGIVWEALEAITEGLSDAAAIRIAYYLVENQPSQAKRLTSKSIYLGGVQGCIITAIVLMAGPNIAVILSKDRTLQHLIANLMSMVALANLSMTLAQVYWSVVGAQGRFAVASSTILACRWLITIPLSIGMLYGGGYGLSSVGGAISIGFSTASSILAFYVFLTDWPSVAQKLHDKMKEQAISPANGNDEVELNDNDEESDIDEDDESSSDDSSTGIGM